MEPPYMSEDAKIVLAARRLLLKVFDRGAHVVLDLWDDTDKEQKIFTYNNSESTGTGVIASFVAAYHDTKKETDVETLRKHFDTHIDTLRVCLLISPEMFLKLRELVIKYPAGNRKGLESDTTFIEIIEILTQKVDKKYWLKKFHRYIEPTLAQSDARESAPQESQIGASYSDGNRSQASKVLRQIKNTGNSQEKVLRQVGTDDTESDEMIGSSEKLKKFKDSYVAHIPVVALNRRHKLKKAEKAAKLAGADGAQSSDTPV